MGKYLKLEEARTNPAIILIDGSSGTENVLLNLISEQLKDSFNLYGLTTKKVPSYVERLSLLSIHFLDKLAKEPSFAIIFLEQLSQKRKTFELIEKLTKGKTIVVVVVSFRAIEEFIDLLQACKGKKGVVFVLLGDVFGSQFKKSALTRVISKGLAEKEIVLSGDDLSPLFPISQEDVLSGLQQIMFGSKDSYFIYALFYDHPQTSISLSHVLKRLEPELSITFDKKAFVFPDGKSREEKDQFIKQKLGVSIRPLEESFLGFEKSVQKLLEGKTSLYVPSKRRLKIKVTKKSTVSATGKIIAYIMFSFFLFLTCSFVLFFGSLLEFKKGMKALSSGDITASKKEFLTAKNMYQPSQEVIKFISSIPTLFGQNEPLRYFNMYSIFISEVEQVTSILEKSLSKNSSVSKEDIKNITSSVFNFFFLNQELSDAKITDYLNPKRAELPSSFFSVLYVLPSLLGYDSPKSYLILLQNNNELRPTGGFIGSVASLTLNKGKIENLKIQDVYDLDGQLKGHIEPPYIVRRYLQPHLYLRDSNFNPEFSDSASSSALLYNLESGETIDGVVAIDTEVLKALVEIEGSITIPGQEKQLTSNNIVSVLQDSIQENFFPGSAQKKLILNALMSHIIADLEQDEKKKLLFLQKLSKLLIEKHVLVSFAKPSLEKAFIASSFAGSLTDNRIVDKKTVSDFFSLNEANIGVNKSNEFVSRKVEYSVLLKSAELDSDALVSFTNSSKDDYKSYVRFIVPENANLLKIIIDGADQEIIPAVINPEVYERKGFQAPEGLEVDQSSSGGKKFIGFLINVKPSAVMRVRILYKSPTPPSEEDFSVYSLLFIKQPGTTTYPLSVLFQTDGSYKMKNQGSSPFLFDGKINSDKEIKSSLLRVK